MPKPVAKLPYLFVALLSFLLTLLVHRPGQLTAPTLAQTVPGGGYTLLVEAVAQQVYEKFPTIPKANDYRRQEDGEVDVDNTLISRFIRYHRDIKKRPTRYRLDWKLTFADYLGVNESISADRYPGFATLQTSPLDGDRQLIEALNRQQRQDLVNFLAEVYRPQTTPSPPTPDAPQPSTNPNNKPRNNPPPSPGKTPNEPALSKPGDAQLLMP